jgi:acid phosphatase class B
MRLIELRELIRLHINEARISKKPVHRIFDFDDTLVFTDAMVHVNDKEGKHKKSMTPAQYAVYSQEEDDVFDYGDFNKLINPREVKWIVNILRTIVNKNGPQGATILTARSAREPVEKFLKDNGFPEGIEIVALGDSNPYKKSEWISNKINQDGLRQVEFFDDSHKNIKATKELRAHHPECRIIARHIVHNKKH